MSIFGGDLSSPSLLADRNSVLAIMVTEQFKLQNFTRLRHQVSSSRLQSGRVARSLTEAFLEIIKHAEGIFQPFAFSACFCSHGDLLYYHSEHLEHLSVDYPQEALNSPSTGHLRWLQQVKKSTPRQFLKM